MTHYPTEADRLSTRLLPRDAARAYASVAQEALTAAAVLLAALAAWAAHAGLL